MTAIQHWQFCALVFDPAQLDESRYEPYAAVPMAMHLGGDRYRIYFSARDKQNRSLPLSLEYDLGVRKVISLSQTPLLTPGAPGTFDDSGIMPCELIQVGSEWWMYYIGWNLGVSVPFRNALGLAVSTDGGLSFTKKFEGPVLDRSETDPYFIASTCVRPVENGYRAWYLTCRGWEPHEGKLQHKYHLRIAHSDDGIHWKREGKVAIDFAYPNEYAISVPRVVQEDGIWKMWYSHRGGPRSEQYQIGYAESANGLDWTRRDAHVELDSHQAWDSEMKAYPFIFAHAGRTFMLYNGNGFGKTGFGLAQLQEQR